MDEASKLFAKTKTELKMNLKKIYTEKEPQRDLRRKHKSNLKKISEGTSKGTSK